MKLVVWQSRHRRRDAPVLASILLIAGGALAALEWKNGAATALAWAAAFAALCTLVIVVGSGVYCINEAGIARTDPLGLFLWRKIPWSAFRYVGVLDVVRRFSGDFGGKAIVCATFIPKREHLNGSRYRVPDRDAVKIEYDAELYETVLRLHEAAKRDGRQPDQPLSL